MLGWEAGRVVRGVCIFYGGIMFKALIRHIVEAVRGAIENEQERVDLSVRIPAGYLVACRRAPKPRRQPRDKVEMASRTPVTSKRTNVQSKRHIPERQHQRKNADSKKPDDQFNKNIKPLQTKNSNPAKRFSHFPHLEFGPDAADYYENLRGDVLWMVRERLNLLNLSAIEWRVNGGKEPFLTEKAHWWKCYARDESDEVKRNPRYRYLRRFRSCHGGKEFFYWHINCGKLDGKKGRIHFRFDEITHEVEVGYIGGHLETPTG